MTTIKPVYRIHAVEEDALLVFFCDNPQCGSNLFHENATGRMVCNGCETPARVRPNAVLTETDFTVVSDRIVDERLQ